MYGWQAFLGRELLQRFRRLCGTARTVPVPHGPRLTQLRFGDPLAKSRGCGQSNPERSDFVV